MKGVILHGGHGTRLRPLTHTGPKQLLPIANKPMSQYCVESLREAGVVDIAMILGGVGSNKVRDYYGTGQNFGVNITYIEQDQPRGIAHAVRICKEFINDEKFLVFLGDNIIQKSISDIAKNFEQSDAEATVLLCEVDNPTRFGIADVKNKKITKIMEKPSKPPTNLAVTGIYFLTPVIFDIIDRQKPSRRNELEITDALQMMLDENHKITYHMITDYWKDTGTPEDILHANKAILEKMKPSFDGQKEENVTINGNVIVGEGAVIKSNSTITGPVIIGKNCVIESNTRVGPNTSIGDNSMISNCDISDSIVMSDCLIDCNIAIRDSIIAFDSKLISNTDDKNGKIFLLGERTKIVL